MSQQRPDKQKVIGEVITEDKARSFLDYEPYDDENRDFHRLLKAYRGLPADGFRMFLDAFIAEGGDIHAPNKDGVKFIDYIRPNKLHQEYIDVLLEKGA